MNRKNIFQRYLFRKDFFWKVKEKLFWFIRNNSRNAFKDQRILLKNLESGIILDVNLSLEDAPELINSEPYSEGWVFTIKSNDCSELDELIDANIYEELTEKGL